MAFTSIGYDGSVNEKQWAELIPSAGSSAYGVTEADDLKVTAVPGQPLTVSVASGSGWGHGVLDTETANTTIACEAITSGTRWDLIALRRNWQPLAGGPTSVVKVTGTSTKELPGGRKVVPGVEDDQPLALVQWTAGQTQPSAIVDLRCWAGNGGLVAVDPMVKLYLNKIGTRVSLPGSEWKLMVGDNDLPTWVELGAATNHLPIQVNNYSITGSIDSEVVGTRRRVTVDLNVSRTGPDIAISTSFAGFGPILPIAVRGTATQKYVPVSLSGGDSPGNNNHATAFLNPIDGSMSIRGQASFTWNTGALFSLNCVYYI